MFVIRWRDFFIKNPNSGADFADADRPDPKLRFKTNVSQLVSGNSKITVMAPPIYPWWTVWAAGWQNQGYAWYIVPRNYTEKVGLIEWRDQFLKKNPNFSIGKRSIMINMKLRCHWAFRKITKNVRTSKKSGQRKVGLIALCKRVPRTYRFFCHPGPSWSDFEASWICFETWTTGTF